MPPRAQNRRRSRDPKQVHPGAALDNRLVNFQKPNLPTLQGTPSSRRQYSYGSPLEPAPVRQMRRGAAGNLASAVQGALSPTGRGEMVEVLIDRSSRPQPQVAHGSTVDEDELLGSEADYRPSHDDVDDVGDHEDIDDVEPDAPDEPQFPTALSADPPSLVFDDDEMSDARSFGMEDDYFDEAVIGSVNGDVFAPPPVPPRDLPPAPRSTAPPANFNSSTSARSSFARNARSAAAEPGVLPFNDDGLDLDLQPIRTQSDRLTSTIQVPGTDKHADRSDASALITPPETDSLLSQEGESARNSFENQTETPRPSFLASIGSRAGLFQARKPITDPLSARAGTNESSSRGPRRPFEISPAGLRPDFFRRANGPRAPASPSRSFWFSPRRSDRDESSQRDSTPPNPDDAPLRRQAEVVNNRRRRGSPDSYDSDELDDDDYEWLQALNPVPHLQAMSSSLRTMLGAFFKLLLNQLSHLRPNDFYDQMTAVSRNVIYSVAVVFALYAATTFWGLAYDNLPSEVPSVSVTPGHFSIALPSLGEMAGRIGRIVPSLSWSSPDDDFEYKWDETHSGGGPDDRRLQKLEEWLRDIHRELVRLKDSTQMHEASLKKLESVIPKLVLMKLKGGKPVVAPEFWHAIRDLIHQDDTFLSLEKNGKEYDFANEKQWNSIVSRLNKDPAFASQLNLTTSRVEGNVKDEMTRRLPAFWDSWVSDNEYKISQMVGAAVDKIDLPKAPRDIEAKISELVEKHMGKNAGGSVIVTRDEFLRHLSDEFYAHRADIKNEINELHPKLEQLVKDSIALARDDLPEGITRSEVERLVQTLVSKSIADMNLEALAKGRIHAYWDKDLRNQVNYFGIGAGAVINPKLTSQTYQPGSDDFNRRGLLATDPNDAFDALLPWLEDGNCWCGARGTNDRGSPYDVKLGVTLGHSIIPQQVVVEHIHPLATTDPGARPRDIEVYAWIDDPVIRGRVQDFAAAHFPGDKDDWQYTPADLPSRFVKIGQFAYEGAERHDGVHVHHLSTELLALGAETEQVVIRATSNYGAKLHTCFYRVRLFGQRVEEPTAEHDAAMEGSTSRWRFWERSRS